MATPVTPLLGQSSIEGPPATPTTYYGATHTQIYDSVLYGGQKLVVCPTRFTFQLGPKTLKPDASLQDDDPEGGTQLHLAAEIGAHDLIQSLLTQPESNLDIEGRDNHGQTALHRAAKNSHNPTVQTLLDLGANANATNNLGMTPLHAAGGGRGTTTTVRMLLSHDADLMARDQIEKTALHHAADVGNWDAALALIEHGIDKNTRDRMGRTALDRALLNL
ncbi:ankyrin repeat-containing domain protein [Trichophaea hybrida]|nr:ankyrin repeat-containing domain protein [Trichophaea hybrida]